LKEKASSMASLLASPWHPLAFPRLTVDLKACKYNTAVKENVFFIPNTFFKIDVKKRSKNG